MFAMPLFSHMHITEYAYIDDMIGLGERHISKVEVLRYPSYQDYLLGLGGH